ncbi:MAG: acetate--CoA ligase family protein [Candidatus Micrarchaeota archaeon]|nr:acetate--CoA ligase family protein [Candidatus Micrarchaeota archaeon]
MALVEYFEAERLLKKYKIRSVESRYVKSAEEAEKFSAGGRIVLKAVSGKALHKSKSGLVVAGISGGEIGKAYSALERRAAKYRPYRILAQKMVHGGIEIIIGGSEDVQFGKMILLGLGGIYVEAFKDFALRVCPINMEEALSMIRQLRSRKIIAPDRASEKMVAELILKAARMYQGGRMKELDLNPIIIHDGTYDAVDIRMIK